MDSGSGGGSGGVGLVRWLCHSRDDEWGAELRAGNLRRLCSATETKAMRTKDVRDVLGGVGGAHTVPQGGFARSVVLDTEEVGGALWRFVCGGGPTRLAKPGAHRMRARPNPDTKKMSKAEIKAAAHAKAHEGGWVDDDPSVVPAAAAAAKAADAEANHPLAPNPHHARWCRELFGDSPEAVGGRLFGWLVRPAGPLKTAVQAYFRRVLNAGFTAGLFHAHSTVVCSFYRMESTNCGDKRLLVTFPHHVLFIHTSNTRIYELLCQVKKLLCFWVFWVCCHRTYRRVLMFHLRACTLKHLIHTNLDATRVC
jgi:hypothetical protein